MAQTALVTTQSLQPDYEILETTDTIVYVVNFDKDIRLVVQNIKEEYPNHRIVYRTSINNWNEIIDDEIIPFIRPLKKARNDAKLMTAKEQNNVKINNEASEYPSG